MEKFDFTLPGLGKPKSSRPDRIAEAILQELSILLRQEVRDARLSRVAFSRAQTTPDLKQARIWFTVPKGISSTEARKGLERASGFFRSHLAKTLNLRHTPELTFFYDKQNEELERLEQLFTQINKERPEESEQSE